MYEDNLYMSNLYEFLDTPTMTPERHRDRRAPMPGDGVRFEDVTFAYPGLARARRSSDVDLHIPPGSKLALVGENGSGKTTLIKLLTRLYEPTEGPIMLDGRDLREWDRAALRRRIGVIFQDFVRYQLTVGENIGAGDDRAYEDASAGTTPPSAGSRSRSSTTLPERVRHAARQLVQATAASCRAASGRRSRSRARSCAATPTSSCSTSRPRRWTPRPR